MYWKTMQSLIELFLWHWALKELNPKFPDAKIIDKTIIGLW